VSVKSATDDELIEFPFAEKSITIGNREWRFRELSVQENDDCADASKDKDGRINGRTMMRLTIIASAIDPKITTSLLAKMPARVYGKIYDVVNELQNPDTLDDKEDDENKGGND
jgi:hypothetical protein